MARATSKTELVNNSEAAFEKLFALIASLTPEAQNRPFAFDDRDHNLRDVLVHLYEWHRLFIDWVAANRRGESASFLPAPYNWRTYPQMNVHFWEKHQATPLDTAVTLLKQSHADVMAIVATFTDNELFEKKHFAWTGSSSLGSYAVSSTASHYDWAIKKITKHKKTLL